jgi:hypothetical protein
VIAGFSVLAAISGGGAAQLGHDVAVPDRAPNRLKSAGRHASANCSRPGLPAWQLRLCAIMPI